MAARGIHTPTPVQQAVIATFEGSDMAADLAVSAPTGAGKTLAFGIALAPHVLGADGQALRGQAPRAVVVVPTRDLAAQVRRELAWLYAGSGARVLCCAGGSDRAAEAAILGAGAEIVVGSPGRLCDHLATGVLDPRQIGALVLDEADELLAGGFLAEIRALLRALPGSGRVILCSATLPPGLAAHAAELRGLHRAHILVTAQGTAAPAAMQAIALPRASTRPALAALLREQHPARALIFGRQRAAVAELAAWLRGAGFRAVELSGALPRRRRALALAGFRDGLAEVCVATDLAARGLDLVGIGLVIHLGLPHGAAGLVHRNGRAGRGGQPGRALIIVTPAERRRAEALARRTGIALDWIPPPPAQNR